jgi:hypothetical protein
MPVTWNSFVVMGSAFRRYAYPLGVHASQRYTPCGYSRAVASRSTPLQTVNERQHTSDPPPIRFMALGRRPSRARVHSQQGAT